MSNTFTDNLGFSYNDTGDPRWDYLNGFSSDVYGNLNIVPDWQDKVIEALELQSNYLESRINSFLSEMRAIFEMRDREAVSDERKKHDEV